MFDTVELGELLALNGLSYGIVQPGHRDPRGIPIVRVSDIESNAIDRSSPLTVSREVEAKHARTRLAGGEVLLSVVGTVGRVAVVSPSLIGWNVARAIAVLRPRDLADAAWIRYCLESPAAQRQMRLRQTDTVQATLNLRDVRRLEVPYPPSEERHRIEGVLGALDDLIDVNERIRSTLDRKGQALIEDLVLRRPDHDLVTLGQAASVIETGRRPRGGVRGIDNGVPSIGAESIDGVGVFDFSKTKYVPADFAATMRTGVLENRDVLIYKDGGKPGDFRPHVGMYGDGFPFATMTINEHVYRVRAAAPFTEPYLYFWLSTDTAMAAMRRLGTGAAIPGLNSTALRAVPVANPPSDVRALLLPALEALVAEALAAASEAHRLAQARDQLLPLLLSRRVRVHEVSA